MTITVLNIYLFCYIETFQPILRQFFPHSRVIQTWKKIQCFEKYTIICCVMRISCQVEITVNKKMTSMHNGGLFEAQGDSRSNPLFLEMCACSQLCKQGKFNLFILIFLPHWVPKSPINFLTYYCSESFIVHKFWFILIRALSVCVWGGGCASTPHITCDTWFDRTVVRPTKAACLQYLCWRHVRVNIWAVFKDKFSFFVTFWHGRFIALFLANLFLKCTWTCCEKRKWFKFNLAGMIDMGWVSEIYKGLQTEVLKIN